MVSDAAEVLKKAFPLLGQGGIVQREMTEEGNCRLMAPLIFFRKRQQKIPEASTSGNLLEVTTRFELVDEGFADPCLTTWPRHHIKE